MKIDIPSDYVKAKENIRNGDIIRLLDEGKWNELEDKRSGKVKKVLTFQMELMSGDVKIYTMNKTTMRNMIRGFGTNDSKQWMNKNLKAHIVKQMAFGKLTDVLILTPESWAEPTPPTEEIKAEKVK